MKTMKLSRNMYTYVYIESPLENVKITTNPASTTVFTDSEGNFKIEDILVGDYSVQAEKDNFETSFEF